MNASSERRQRAVRMLSAAAVAAAFLLPVLVSKPAHAQNNAARATQFYEDALKRHERKDFDGAAVQLRNVLSLDRNNLAAHLLLGRVLLAADQTKAAEASLEEALRLGVSKVEVLPLLGQVYLRLGDPQKLLDTVQLKDGPVAARVEVLMMRGSAHAMRGAVTAASADYAEARRLDPRAAAPWVAEVPLFLRAGDVTKALAAATKATELEPNNATAWQQLGTVQQAQGLMQRALESQNKALQLQPKLVDALVAKAGLLLSLDRRAEAQTLLQQLKADKVRDPRASVMRSMLAEAAGQRDVARQEYVEAAELVDALPGAARIQNDASLMSGAMAHRALGNRERTREYLDSLLARNPRHLAGSLMLAEALLDEQQTNRAAGLIEGVLRDAPMNGQALMLMGRVHLARRQYDQAAEMFDRAGRVGGGTEAQRELGIAQMGAQRDGAALANLEKVFAQNPADVRAGIELAIFHARRGNRQKALQVADAVVARDPRNPAMLNFLGNVKGRLGDNAGLRQAYEQALVLDPKYRPVLINLSRLDIDEGKLDPARRRLAEMLKQNEGDIEVLLIAGELEQRARRFPQAQELWQRANGTQTRDPRPGLSLAELQLSQRKLDEAHQTARSLATRFPDSVPVLHLFARTQLALQQLPAARTTLQEAAKFAAFDPLALVATAKLQLQADHPQAAAHSLSKALQAKPDDIGALVAQVELASRRGDAPGVDVALRKLNQAHPGQVPTLITAGHVAMSRRQPAQALVSYRAAYDKETGPHTALLLSQAHLALNQPAQALTLMTEMAKRHPGDPITLRALAELQLMQGKLTDARQTYATLVQAAPDDAELNMTYARVLAELKDPGALAQAEKAVKLDPNHAGIVAAYGTLLMRAGDASRGLRVLQEARLRDPGNAWIRVQLATALHGAGQTASAREELRAALAGTPPPPPSPELAQLRTALGL